MLREGIAPPEGPFADLPEGVQRGRAHFGEGLRFNDPVTRWAAHAFYDALMSAGVRTYEYQPRMLHAKIVGIDGDWATVGTANLDYRSLFLNYELLLAIREPGICTELEQQFLDDLRKSLPITPAHWASDAGRDGYLRRLGGSCAAGFDGATGVARSGP